MEKMVDQNEKMVEASTMPLLDSGMTYDDDHRSNKAMFRIALKNSGVGPAIIDRFEVRYKGMPYSVRTVKDLLMACCKEDLSKSTVVGTSSVSGIILPARESTKFLEIPLNNAPSFESVMQKNIENFSIKACYCSVLDKCWETNFNQMRPTPVASCKVNPGDVLW